jgi:hypothetical protein
MYTHVRLHAELHKRLKVEQNCTGIDTLKLATMGCDVM